MMGTLSKSERTDLVSLIRKREKVQRAAASQRAAELNADLERQLATIYRFDDDKIWKAAYAAADLEVAKAQEVIAERAAELGIPREFAPGIGIGWHGRGENAVASRRAELRRVGQSKIEAMEKTARAEIERIGLQAQTEVLAFGMDSDLAKEFLTKVTTVEELMPPVDATLLVAPSAE